MNQTSDPSDIISTFYLRKYGWGRKYCRFEIDVKLLILVNLLSVIIKGTIIAPSGP